MPKKPERLTRHALARRLGVSESSVDRLIRGGGLVPVATRGPAKLYRLEAARRLLQRRAPSSPDLVAALIARQDALSRRTAAKITQILDTHIEVGDVARLWIRIVETVRARLGRVPEEFVERRAPENPDAVRRVLTEMVDEALSELRVTDQDRARAAERPPAPLAPPVVRRSRSLAEARAQGAWLQAEYYDLKDRIVPLEESHG